jgi:DNA-binding NtrC family response regulator
MVDKLSETTVEEEPMPAPRAAKLALVWVWPFYRVDGLQGARISIGRDESPGIQLQGSGVSRRHAELYRQGPLYVLRDAASTNGTWLDGRRVEHAPVGVGQVVRMGDCVGVFALRGESSKEFGEHAPAVFGGPEIAELLEPVKRAAGTTVPVLLIGDTGTGKERLARAVHHFSGRTGPFIAVNCAALPEQLAEAELFGYRRGAFTGAERASLGYFRGAHQGTLFLDEMPELSPALQAKLLRVVEDNQVTGLGETTPSSVDVRLVSASQKAVSQLVTQGKLREDLAARLSGLQVELPALATRRADVAPLFLQFLKERTGGRPPAVEARVVEALCLHSWPRNVRELELMTRTLLAVHGHERTLRRQHLPAEIVGLLPQPNDTRPSSPPRGRREHDLARLKAELASNGGSVKAAAEVLGISRQRVYRLLDGAEAEASSPGSRVGGDDDARN